VAKANREVTGERRVETLWEKSCRIGTLHVLAKYLLGLRAAIDVGRSAAER
jgi:hypothetical protein